MKNNKKLLLLLLALCFIFFTAGSAQALELTYPDLPGLVTPSSSCTGNDCLSLFVSYWFGFLVYIAGFLSLISFVVGAVGLINPNLEAHNDAKDRMKGAVLGLVLVFSSFVIMKTINTNLVNLSIAPLPGVDGIYYVNGNGDRRPVAMEVPNISQRPEGYDTLAYICTNEGTAPALLVWKYPQINYKGSDGEYAGITVIRLTCENNTTAVNGGSFKMTYETPGIYYCMGGCSGSFCQGYMSGVVTSDQNQISEPFNSDIKGVRIVNSSSDHYGVIFHDASGLDVGGSCSYPLINTGNSSICVPVQASDVSSYVAFAANVFKINKNGNSGNGIIFYSKDKGWNTDSLGNRKAGSYKVENKDIKFLTEINAEDMCFEYDNVDILESEKYKCSESKCGGEDYACESDADCYDYIGEWCDTGIGLCVAEDDSLLCSDQACETFQDCPGSTQILGSYLVAFYSEDSEGKAYCYSSKNNIENIGSKGVIDAGKTNIKFVYIIPIK